MRVEVLRPHRNDHPKDDGKPGWKHTGTSYEHPEPEADINAGLIRLADDNPVRAQDPADPKTPEPQQVPPTKPAAKTAAPKKAAAKKAAPKKTTAKTERTAE